MSAADKLKAGQTLQGSRTAFLEAAGDFLNNALYDPSGFIDAEIIKAKLESIEAALERIEENLGTDGKTKRKTSYGEAGAGTISICDHGGS